MAIATAAPDTPIESALWNTMVGAWNGTAGKGQPLVATDIGSADWLAANTGVDPDDVWAGTFRNRGDDGLALRALDKDGNVIFSAAQAGVVIGGFASGSAASPAVAFVGDTDTGLYRIGANEAALAAGASAAIRWRLGSKFPQVGIGMLDESGAWTWTGGNDIAVHIHHVVTATDGDVINLHSELTTDASSGGAGAVPDSSAITGVVYQTASGADGAIRAGEFQTIRTSTAANANSTAYGIECGIHTSQGGDGTAKVGGINLISSESSPISGTGVRADNGLYIHGALGYSHPIRVLDETALALGLLFDVDQVGRVLAGATGDVSLPTWAFTTDTDTGIYRVSANVLGFGAGATEFARGTATGFQITLGMTHASIITPTTISANTDDWAPTGLSTATIIRAVTDASRNLSGIVAQANGRVIYLCNAGATNNLVLLHNSTSTAANRFFLPNGANLTLLPNMSIPLFYDSSTAGWRALAGYVS